MQTSCCATVQFAKAVALTGAEFEDAVSYSINSWLPGRALVQEALDAAKAVHPSCAPSLFVFHSKNRTCRLARPAR